MKVFNISNLDELISDNNKRVAALGFFDGVHNAHQNIISEAAKFKKDNFIPVVITLDRSPKEYFKKNRVECLTPIKKKNELLESLGVEEVYYLKFNDELQKVTAEQFIDKVLKKLNVEKVFCGYDYKFGNQGLGTPQYIEEYTKGQIKAYVFEKQTLDDLKISTTRLRDYVVKGNFDNYYKLTSRRYSISGIVVQGRQLGRTINFPTANLDMQDKYLLPETNGVYITQTKVLGKVYKSLTNIGTNPTVSNNGEKKFIETHILDFDADIYGEEIEIYFYNFLRAEKKFNGLNELKEQLELDKKWCENLDLEKRD